MRKALSQVEKFHQAFHLPINEVPLQEYSDKTWLHQYKIISEEANELSPEVESGTIEQVAKETADLIYVVLGSVLVFGIKEQFFQQCGYMNLDILGSSIYPQFTITPTTNLNPLYKIAINSQITFTKKLLLETLEQKDQTYLDLFIGGILQTCIHTIRTFGLQNRFRTIFDAVHENNMEKVPKGTIHYDQFGKPIKPKDHKKIDVTALLDLNKS